MEFNLTFTPSSPAQVYFLNSTKRNILFNSGYGAGKTFVGCFKLLLLLLKFPKSRAVIGRQRYSDLMKTTAQTFFQVCPASLYDTQNGGSYNKTEGKLVLANGSEIFFMHFDNADLNSVKSLEINFMLLDQAEEIGEAIYLGLDARLGRKSDAEVPEDLLKSDPNWPRNEHTGKPLVPVYSFILINPPDEGEMNYLIQRFHPDSPEWQEKWQETNDYIWSSSRDNKALSKENLENMLTRDQAWIDRYVDGKIGQGEGAIHIVHPASIVEVTPVLVEFITNLRKKANLSRVLDHGASAPTCCLWFATYKGFYFCYQEYYMPERVISYHRQAISDLSAGDYYFQNLADPSMFHKTSEKYGGFWTLADEYGDIKINAPALIWNPGDNDEFATRNRINELLRFNPDLTNPITGALGSPRIFFFKRTLDYPNGCDNIIKQLKSQKKMLLDTINGKPVYCDDRDKKVPDHAYDCLRYYCAAHATSPTEPARRAAPNSFIGLRNRIKALKQEKYFEHFDVIQ